MDLEDFEQVKHDLAEHKLDGKMDMMMKNYQINEEDFAVEFETMKYTIQDKYKSNPAGLHMAIVNKLEDKFAAKK